MDKIPIPMFTFCQTLRWFPLCFRSPFTLGTIVFDPAVGSFGHAVFARCSFRELLINP